MNESPPADAEPVDFSVVIPCYNEEGAIRETVLELANKLSDAGLYEIIVVDDGSSDGSAELLDRTTAEVSQLRVFRHPSNRGYGAALKTGIRRARSEQIVITDADGTYPNERIPEFVQALSDCDMVVGARTTKEVKYSKLRSIPKAFLRTYASWIAGQMIPDMNSGLRAFRRPVVERFLTILPDGFSFTTTITLALLTNYYLVRFIPIAYHPRVGKSKIKPIRDTLRFTQLIVRTGMYFAPLRILAPIAAVLILALFFSLGYDLFVLQDLTDKTVLLFLFVINTIMFGLLADMIDKRVTR